MVFLVMLRSEQIFESGNSDERWRKMSASRFVRGTGSESDDVIFFRNLSLASFDKRSRKRDGISVEAEIRKERKRSPWIRKY